MFHYCSGIFIILFLWEHNFFPPFRFCFFASVYILFTAPSAEFSWKCSVFSTRILLLSNRVLRHKTLKQGWIRRRDGTDIQGRKALEEYGGERWRQTGRECACMCVYAHSQNTSAWWPSISFSTCYLKSFPSLTGSVYLASRGNMVLNVPALPSSGLCSYLTMMSYISHALMVHSSPAASVQCLSEGGYAFF